jgi:hypothetical protein
MVAHGLYEVGVEFEACGPRGCAKAGGHGLSKPYVVSVRVVFCVVALRKGMAMYPAKIDEGSKGRRV